MAWKYFKLAQFSASTTAKTRGIDNTPKDEYYTHVDELVTKLLDPLRIAWGSDIIVTSGYRCDALNAAIGGSKTSAHSLAYAADMVPVNGKLEEFKLFVMNWLKDNPSLQFDQYINEYKGKSSWVHLGIRNRSGQQRKQYMLFQNGKYTHINPHTFTGVDSDTKQITNESSTNTSYTVTYSLSGSISTGNTIGKLTGKSVYLSEDLEAIKENPIFVKDEAGNPQIDPITGMYMVSDEYLIGLDESIVDTIENIDELETYHDPKLDTLFENIENEEVEEVSGITFDTSDSKFGSYVLKQSKSLQELMCMVQQWWEFVQSLKRASQNYQETKLEASQEDEITVIDATVVTKKALDKFGRALANGMTCPVCGKKVKYLGMGGYCSTECVLTDAKNKVMSYLLAPNKKYKDFQACLTELEKILDQTILLINAISMIPDILKELASFPEEYRKFVKEKITEGFCELRELIAKLMVKKNELLKKMMRPMKLGWICKPVAFMFTAIQAVQNAMIAAQDSFDYAYGVAMQFINSLSLPAGPNLALKAGSFGWLCTPRSYMSPLPYTSPSATKIIVELPGGAGTQSLLLTKPLCPSGLKCINFTLIEETIQACFPPLTPLDYYLEPDLFQIRFLFSDQSDLVSQIRQQLTDLFKGGPDYMPSFENMFPIKKYTNMTIAGVTIPEVWLPNIGYLWFLMGLLDAWAPRSQGLVGSLLNPAI